MSRAADDLIDGVLTAVADGEPGRARLLLHPYLHWTEGDVTVRGRSRVLALLGQRSMLDQPSRVELRDGQIYRWVDDRDDDRVAREGPHG